jgi:hypothetical protein
MSHAASNTNPSVMSSPDHFVAALDVPKLSTNETLNPLPVAQSVRRVEG